MERVVVTGLGLCTSIGKDVPTCWNALISSSGPGPGNHQVAPLDQVQGFEKARFLAISAAKEAIDDSGLSGKKELACTLSASKPFLASPQTPLPSGEGCRRRGEAAFTVISPDEINRSIRERFDLQGESRNVIAACATGAYSIAMAASWIEQGLCEAALAGSVEPYPHPLYEAGFSQMGVLSKENVMRPFDQKRTGFVFGEGAGAVMLESEAHAARRGKTPHARLAGWGLGADAHSAVAFNSNGARIADVIRKALQRSDLPPAAISHINAHGTATRLNDWLETQALLQAFGDHARHLKISATKSTTGHLLGAAGSVEFIFTVLALANQIIPPTRHLETPDAECSLNYTAGTAQHASFENALTLSFGFGGPIGALIASRE
jgi:3-oxoacyl-[acyl-carrier-protein] synthase II